MTVEIISNKYHMMSKKIFNYLIFLVLLLGLFSAGVNMTLAHGWFGRNLVPDDLVQYYQKMFEDQAKILGISVEEIKNAWVQGKNLWDIAQEKGISQDQLQQKIRELKLQKIKDQLQVLVNKGVINQTQANQRLQFIESKMNQARGKFGMGFYGRGFHRGCIF